MPAARLLPGLGRGPDGCLQDLGKQGDFCKCPRCHLPHRPRPCERWGTAESQSPVAQRRPSPQAWCGAAPCAPRRPHPQGHAHGVGASVHTSQGWCPADSTCPSPGKPHGRPGPQLVGSQAQRFRAGFHSAWKPAAWKKDAAWEALQPPKSFFGFTGLASAASLAGRGPG